MRMFWRTGTLPGLQSTVLLLPIPTEERERVIVREREHVCVCVREREREWCARPNTLLTHVR